MRRTQALAGLFGVTLMGVLVAACGGSRQQGQISPEARLHVAEAAESSGDLGLARKMYVTAATEAWGNRTILLQAARGLARSGAPADAIALLDARLGQVPGDNEARRTLASLQIVNGSPGEAAKNLRQVLAAQPGDDTARLNLAVSLDMLRRHSEAQPLYREILLRTPSDTEAANDLALSLMLSGQQTEARAVLQPFRGRADLPERLKTTFTLVDSPPGAETQANVAALSRALSGQAAATLTGPRPK